MWQRALPPLRRWGSQGREHHKRVGEVAYTAQGQLQQVLLRWRHLMCPNAPPPLRRW